MHEYPTTDKEQTDDLQDQLETKDVDGEVEVEKVNELNEDLTTAASEVVDDVKELEEEEEEEEEEAAEEAEEADAEEEEDQVVQDTSGGRWKSV